MNYRLFVDIIFGLKIYHSDKINFPTSFIDEVLDILSVKILNGIYSRTVYVPLIIYFCGYFFGFKIPILGFCRIFLYLSPMCLIYRLYKACTYCANEEYIRFQTEREKYISDTKNLESIRSISKFYTDFNSYPISFSMKHTFQTKRKNKIPFLLNILLPLSYIVNAVIFAGSSTIFHAISFFHFHLLRGRWISHNNVIRFKIKTLDNNLLDVYYQQNTGPNLVIVSDGNASHAEMGGSDIFHKNGYSTISWNYPGYGCSSGSSNASTLQYASEAILGFAFQHLKYNPENIVLCGFSIGCYPTSYLATVVPEVKGIILDSPFDHIINLVPKILRKYFKSLLNGLKDLHFDLDVVGNVIKLQSYIKLKIIIKNHDEIVLSEPGNPESNRGLIVILEDVKKQILEKYPLFPVKNMHLQLKHIPWIFSKNIDMLYRFDLEDNLIDETIPSEYGDKKQIKLLVEQIIDKTLKEVASKKRGTHGDRFNDTELIQIMNEMLQ